MELGTLTNWNFGSREIRDSAAVCNIIWTRAIYETKIITNKANRAPDAAVDTLERPKRREGVSAFEWSIRTGRGCDAKHRYLH